MQPIIQVNQDVHNLIRQYGFDPANNIPTTIVPPPTNVWLHYKLVNVQWVPAGNQMQKTPGLLYGDTSGGAKPLIAVESYYLSNSLVETNMILSAFSGQFNGSSTADDGLSRLSAALAYFANGTWSAASAPSLRASPSTWS